MVGTFFIGEWFKLLKLDLFCVLLFEVGLIGGFIRYFYGVRVEVICFMKGFILNFSFFNIVIGGYFNINELFGTFYCKLLVNL